MPISYGFQISQALFSMKILIIGGSGLVGGQCLKVLEEEYEILATHLNYATENTVFFQPLDSQSYKKLPNQEWDYIIHTGAMTHVDRCEKEPKLSYQMTVESTAKLCSYAESISAGFIYISTDYVFDGRKGPYREDSTTNPLNIYGKHKLQAEKLVRQIDNHIIFRVTNVYGDEFRNKNYVSRTLAEIAEGKLAFAAPKDQFATPINAHDIARAIDAAIKRKLIGIYHLASTDYMSRYQLMERIVKWFPNKVFDIEELDTDKIDQIAKRPRFGGLLAQKFLMSVPGFQFSNLDDYLFHAIGRQT